MSFTYFKYYSHNQVIASFQWSGEFCVELDETYMLKNRKIKISLANSIDVSLSKPAVREISILMQLYMPMVLDRFAKLLLI